MDAKQVAILNSLVTFAAEHIQGGLSEDEREVAQMVGRWALGVPQKTHDYKVVNFTVYGHTLEYVANLFAEMGWRVVGFHDLTLVLERPVGLTHPND